MHCIEIERGELVCAAQSIATEEDDNDMRCIEREVLICVAERYSVGRGGQQDRTYIPARTLVPREFISYATNDP